ncbi:MAG TPA: YkgJ family cysteine cluster protein [Cytophagaceae bacterium]|nr:YkgJ family cysteine cluster protein [Cytophagaceae bacterium]
MLEPTLQNINNLARNAAPETKKLFAKLKKTKPKNLDETFERLHDEAFETIDCLQCANCCKTTSPIFTLRDIERLAKHFKIKTSQFIDQYLHLDEDNDYVLNHAPCPFLGPDNYCSVYENRPNACREYPHTNRKKMYQILDLTLKNTYVCPAVYQVVEKLKQELK